MKKLSFAELKGRVSWGSVFGGVDSFLYSCNMRSEYTKK